MNRVREIVSVGLQERSNAGVKVRQPLSSLFYGGEKLSVEFESLIAEELNVKKCEHKNDIGAVELDTVITDELKKEGVARELMRIIQSKRKDAGLNPHDKITLVITTNDGGNEIVKKFENIIETTVSAKTITLKKIASGIESELVIDELPFDISFI